VDERGEVLSAAGWYHDPVHRFEFRWFNGERWTADVSVNGRRFVDDLGVGPAVRPDGQSEFDRPTHFGPPPFQPSDRPPTLPRTLAILAFIFGLGGLAISWVPFLFVVGAAGAITALILGTVARRRIRSGTQAGRGLAIAGMVLAVVALCTCVVGFLFTRAVVREILEYAEPGPYDAALTGCTAVDGRVTIAGSIDNLDDRTRDYVMVIEVSEQGVYLTTAHIVVDDVDAGEHRDWDSSRFLDDVENNDPVCRLVDVTGPSPFGLPDD
jgi:hypothetical protein